MPEPPIKVEDFDVMSPLVKTYELKPGHFYLVIVEKGINAEAAYKLLDKIREYHPDTHVFIQVMDKGQKIEVAEKKQNDQTTIPRSGA